MKTIKGIHFSPVHIHFLNTQRKSMQWSFTCNKSTVKVASNILDEKYNDGVIPNARNIPTYRKENSREIRVF